MYIPYGVYGMVYYTVWHMPYGIYIPDGIYIYIYIYIYMYIYIYTICFLNLYVWSSGLWVTPGYLDLFFVATGILYL